MYDLHTHSTASDGILSPESLVSSARAAGVQVLSLTDHDTQAGIPAAQAQARREGITLIPGIELSTIWRGRGIHLLGLGICPSDAGFSARVAAMAETRAARGQQIARALARAGLSDEQGIYREALSEAGSASLGRPHFARALVTLGKVKNQAQAFKKYLGAGKPGDVKQAFPALEEAIAWVLAAGGVAVVAHPLKYDLTRTKIRELLADAASAGAQGAELISGRQTEAETRDMLRLLNEAGLAASLGSDFHLPEQSWQALGCAGVMPEAARPVWALPELQRWLADSPARAG